MLNLEVKVSGGSHIRDNVAAARMLAEKLGCTVYFQQNGWVIYTRPGDDVDQILHGFTSAEIATYAASETYPDAAISSGSDGTPDEP